VWGETGLPGEEDADTPPMRPGMFVNCRLDEDEERCSMSDDDIDSDSWAVESRILENREYCADVRWD